MITIKSKAWNISKIASKDKGGRPNICKVLFAYEEGIAVATNGHCIIVVSGVDEPAEDAMTRWVFAREAGKILGFEPKDWSTLFQGLTAVDYRDGVELSVSGTVLSSKVCGSDEDCTVRISAVADGNEFPKPEQLFELTRTMGARTVSFDLGVLRPLLAVLPANRAPRASLAEFSIATYKDPCALSSHADWTTAHALVMPVRGSRKHFENDALTLMKTAHTAELELAAKTIADLKERLCTAEANLEIEKRMRAK